MENHYKFIIIQMSTKEAVIKNSYNAIEEFIQTVCTQTLSHNSIRQRIVQDGYFEFEDLIIKKLIWDTNS
jgi:hypothetical protein